MKNAAAIRYAVVIIAIVGCAAAFWTGIRNALKADQSLQEFLIEDVVWAAAQTHSELVRLSAEIHEYQRINDRARLSRRVDIVWSRLNVLQRGSVAEFLDQTDLDEVPSQLEQALEDLDAMLAPVLLNQAGHVDWTAASELVNGQVIAIRSWSNSVLHAEQGRMARYASQRDSAYGYIIAAFGGLALGSILFIIAFGLEARSARRSQAAAQEAGERASAAEQRLIDAIEALPEGFALYDSDDRLVICNSRYKEIYSLAAPEIYPGNTFENIIRYGAERAEYVEAQGRVDDWVQERLEMHRNPGPPIEQRLDGGRWLRIEERKTSDGGVVGFRIDISEIKRAEQLLLRAEEAAQLGHWTYNVEDDEIVYSEQLLQLLNLPADSKNIALETFAELIDDGYRQGFYDQLLDLAFTGKSAEYMARLVGNTDRYLLLKIVPELDAKGRVISLFGTAQDITARHLAELRMESAMQHAQEADKAKSQFLAVMSHEIRTPLNGLIGALNLVGDATDPGENSRYIDLAVRSASRLRTVLNDVLDFTRIESGHLKISSDPFDFSRFIQDTMQFWQASAVAKQINLSSEVDAEIPPTLIGDQIRLRQVIDNLISNAIKFTPEGGEVTICAEFSPMEWAVADERYQIRFRILDNGPGLDESVRSKIFREFVQVGSMQNAESQGSGLGLAICHRLVGLMGGEIDFRARRDGGTEFWFDVPMLAMDEALNPIEPQQAARPSEEVTLPSGLQVLLAEDNLTSQIVVEAELAKRGCEVTVVGNGQDAMEAALAGSFDVVLMDVSMPVMSGTDATQAIRKRTSELPIIALTAYASLNEAEQFIQAGMNAVVAKPIDWSVLTTEINRCLATGTSGSQSIGLVKPALSDPEPEMLNDPLIDAPQLTQMLDALSEAAIERMSGQIGQDLAGCQSQLQAGVDDQDLEQLEAGSHKLQGLAGIVFADRLNTAAKLLNDQARAGNLAAALDASQTVLPLISQTNQEFDKFMALRQAGSQTLSADT
ncbi:MAG: response regulator [Alphaproteobacteria bacterium]|nr:response regulator [Alphaproteobacteria bacterium SS10]